MRKLLFLLVLIVISLNLQAQTWDEWFRQKKTQIQYLTQQIAGLQMYAGYLNNGYKIAKSGLHTIGDIKNGELNLHQAFISSLSKVNTKVRNDFRIAAIVSLRLYINQQYNSCLKIADGTTLITTNELQYIGSVFHDLLTNCDQDIGALTSVATDSQLQLSDDERIKRIESIYQSMKDRCQFTQSFCSDINELCRNRQKAINEVKEAEAFYDLK